MNRYRHDPNAPSHLRRLMESAGGDDLDARARRRVAERLGIMPMAIPPAKSDLDPIRRSSSLVYIGTITLAALALFGGGAGYVERTDAGPAPTRAASTSALPVATSVEPSSVVMPLSTTHANSVPIGSIVFTSEGSVMRVDLQGAKPTDDCVRVAPSKAHVQPFAAPTFSTRVTVRP
ncbi:MAG: hypothetical protein J0I07_39425 [Myxococcales bacterium]|nr:hypothetical protein [Myxococcales bacterium]